MTETPTTLDELNKVIQHNLRPPPDAERTGEYHQVGDDKFEVFRERVPVEKRQPMRDADGNVLYHLRADGSKHRPMMEGVVVAEEVQEYILVPVGNGVVQKNYHFRPSEGEMEARRRREEEAAALSELSRFLKEQGKGFGDLVGALKGSLGGRAEEPPARGGRRAASTPAAEVS